MEPSSGPQPTSAQPAATVTGSGSSVIPQYLRPIQRATLTRPIITGTSMRGPMTAANAWPELRPKTATVTAMASSKLLLAAVKLSVAVLE